MVNIDIGGAVEAAGGRRLSIPAATAVGLVLKARLVDPRLRDGDAAAAFASAVRRLPPEQRLDLIALVWLGRGEYRPQDWDEALEDARDIPAADVPRYLSAMPLLADYLEEGLLEFGLQPDACLH